MTKMQILLPICLYIWILICGGLEVHAQSDFNAFKSYKDAAVKPPHYGKKLKIMHPAHEYLSENQLRMMTHRKSKNHHPDAVYKETWTGFDKANRKLEELLQSNAVETEEIPTGEYLRWGCFVVVLCSVGWMCYLLVHRFQHSRHTHHANSVKYSLEKDLEMPATSAV